MADDVIDDILGRVQRSLDAEKQGKQWTQEDLQEWLTRGKGEKTKPKSKRLAEQLIDLRETKRQVDEAQIFQDLPEESQIDNLKGDRTKDEIKKVWNEKRPELDAKDLGFRSFINFENRIEKIKDTKRLSKLRTQAVSKEVREIIVKRERDIGPVTSTFFRNKLREATSKQELDDIIKEAEEKGLDEVGLRSIKSTKEDFEKKFE